VSLGSTSSFMMVSESEGRFVSMESLLFLLLFLFLKL